MLSTSTYPLGTTTAIVITNTYDQVGNKTQVQDGKGQITSFGYDGFKRNTTTTDPANETTTFAYDPINKVQRTDALGQLTSYFYDNRNRLTKVSFADTHNSRNYERDYTFDNNSNPTAVTEPANTGANVSYTYDALDRKITEVSNGLTHSYSYDLLSNRVGVTYGGTNRAITSTYDALNRLSTMAETGRSTGYSYDLNGNIIDKYCGNGDTETYLYDALNRESNRLTTNGQNAIEYQDATGYDLAGNVLSTQETYPASTIPSRRVTNVYDGVYRLMEEDSAAGGVTTFTGYTYDSANNRSSKEVRIGSGSAAITNYNYNNLNQVTGTTGALVSSFAYDLDGERIQLTEGGTTNNYSYDADTRLVGVTAGIGTSGIGTYQYGYDYRTRRILRDESGAGGVVTELVYSGGTSVQEYSNSISQSNLQVEFIRGSDYGGGVGGILYSLRGAAPSYTHTNKRGDITAKSDSGGSLTYLAQYEAFGEPVATYGTTLDRQKSNSKEQDPWGPTQRRHALPR